ncbi:MAG: hypothetical protein KKA60_09485 [Proteobacteria bacterium]|nr:hypothetical protein [Pseudomonadota bacterium]
MKHFISPGMPSGRVRAMREMGLRAPAGNRSGAETISFASPYHTFLPHRPWESLVG